MADPLQPLALDHLVLAARTLEEGLDWCEQALGLRPDTGGRHGFMGTHNRVFAMSSAAFPRSYFEIIAIDPDARAPLNPRWFDLDEPALCQALAERGPQLVHWVARCDSIAAARAAFGAVDIETGAAQRAERATPGGMLRWQISVRADGHRPLQGAAPALIEWGEEHPTDTMPDSGVALQSMHIAGWPAALLPLLPPGIETDETPGAPPIRAVLHGPLGLVTLDVFNPGT